MDKPRVFLDSSVIIAALLSSQGGSSYLLRERYDQFAFQINEYVFAEIQEVVEEKLNDHRNLSTDLFLLLGIAGVHTVPNPVKQELTPLARIISKKDVPILFSAITHSDYLLTLDNEFFKPAIIEAAKQKELAILKPGDFIKLFGL